jgi:hypothetical protein
MRRPVRLAGATQVQASPCPAGYGFDSVSMTATSSSVQIAAQDEAGNIWFYQQNGSTGVWSKAQLVGNLSYSNGEGVQTPKIAWTGGPGHTGTNSGFETAGIEDWTIPLDSQTWTKSS